MSGDDRVRWDARHAAAAPAGVAPPGVLAGAAELTACFPVSGRALDVACGRGGVAVWLARRGLAVDAVDVSPVGLAAGARLAAALRAGIGMPYGCKNGACGSCRGRVVEGRVRHGSHQASALSAED